MSRVKGLRPDMLMVSVEGREANELNEMRLRVGLRVEEARFA